MKGLTKTRGRKVATAIVSTLLVCAAVSFAYYLIAVTFSGEGSVTGGTSSATISEPLTVTTEAGVEPFVPGTEYGAQVNPTIKPAKEIHLLPGAKVAYAISTANEAACKASWFVLHPSNRGTQTKVGMELAEKLMGSGTVAETTYKAAEVAGVGTYSVTFKEEAAVNQSGCEGTQIKVKLTLTGQSH